MSDRPSPVQALQSWICRKASIIAAGYVALFLVIGILTLPNYGLNWDEGLGNLFFGERYLHYFTSFNPVHLNFDAEIPYYQSRLLSIFHSPYHPLDLFQSPFHIRPQEFPPVADTLSAGTMYVFSYILGWMNPIDGFHLFTVILAAMFLWFLYAFAAPRLGKFEAFLAIVFLSVFPRFWGDMHFNDKDVPEAAFFGLAIMAFISWLERPRWWMALLAGVLGGLALGTKANAVFIPVIILIGLIPWSVHLQPWKNLLAHVRHAWWGYGSMILATAVVYFVSWPYLYADPLNRLNSYWSYILGQGDRAGGAAFNFDPIRQALFTMPEIMLVSLAVGMVLVLTRIREPLGRILVAWLLIPILRASLPGAVNFDGIRHFLEFVPAAALIAAYGVGRATRWLAARRVPVTLGRAAFAALLIVNMTGIYLTYYPFLHIYYNQVSGGLAGARNGWLGPDAGDYWNTSYRQGMLWLSQHAPAGSLVRGMTAEWTVELSGPVLLRPDQQVMKMENLPDFSVLDQSDRPIYLMFVIRSWSHLDELAYSQRHKKPVYEIYVDHVPILQIFEFGQNGL